MSVAQDRIGIEDHIESLMLVDHHVHGAWVETTTRAQFEAALNEGNTAKLADWDSSFDTLLGFAIRAHCAPALGLAAHVPADDYWSARESLGERRVASTLLPRAGVSHWLVDEGFAEGVTPRFQLAQIAGGDAKEILRLEALAEEALAAGGSYTDTFRDLLHSKLAVDDAVGLKSIAAYRTGFRIDWSSQPKEMVNERARQWADSGGTRVVDAVLIAFGVRQGLETGYPLQFHVGFGDRDCRIDEANPMHLTPLLSEFPDSPIALLHCYPYEREAGYLAQAYNGVHMDVGLAVNYLGAQSEALIARSLELAPLRKVLFSSDAYGPAELHHLGAVLWRRGMTAVLTNFVDRGVWSAHDAQRVASLQGRDNAMRLYRL